MKKTLKKALMERIVELGGKKVPSAVLNSILKELEEKFQSTMIKRVTPRMVMRHYTSICGFETESKSQKKEGNGENIDAESNQLFPTNEDEENALQQN